MTNSPSLPALASYVRDCSAALASSIRETADPDRVAAAACAFQASLSSTSASNSDSLAALAVLVSHHAKELSSETDELHHISLSIICTLLGMLAAVAAPRDPTH